MRASACDTLISERCVETVVPEDKGPG
jgi:hypothetical protein